MQGTLLMVQAMDKVSIATPMEQYTKDNGKMIDEMEKVLTLGQMATSMQESTPTANKKAAAL